MSQTEATPQAGALWSVLAQAANLLETDPADAERQARELLRVAPGQQQSLQLLVGALRAQGDLARSRALLESMAAEHPNLAAIQYELGLLLAELDQHDAAIRALSRVVELEPKHPHAWRALGDELALTGDQDGAARAYARQFASSVMDTQMLEQVTALDLDKIEIVGDMLREYINIYPTDLAAILMLGQAHVRVRQFESAEQVFEHALELAPSFRNARLEYASLLRQQLKYEREIQQLDALLQNEPDHPDLLWLKATALYQAGRHRESIELCESMLRGDPERPRFWLTYAYALRTIGRQDDCIAAFRKSVGLEPGLGEGWWGLANLKTYRFSPADIQTMDAQLARQDLSVEDRYTLHFALGKALEDRDAYAESFEQYRLGNAQIRARNPYDADDITRNVKREMDRFTGEYFRARVDQGCASPDPIFILGLPRAGSTLVEQILASHSLVEGCGELPALNAIVRGLQIKERSRAESADAVPEPPFEGEDLRALGEDYLERTRTRRILGRPFFTDKMPNNFHHMGLICAALPSARIIDIRRHPMACGFSNFKQIFPVLQGASYELADMGRYYRDYVSLMAHFDRVLPGRVHRIVYEDLVRDPQTEIRRLLDYCRLPFEEGCLRFYESDRSVFTASSEQVRRPVYADSIDQWQHYEPWLGPLKTALGPLLEAYPKVPEGFLGADDVSDTAGR